MGTVCKNSKICEQTFFFIFSENASSTFRFSPLGEAFVSGLSDEEDLPFPTKESIDVLLIFLEDFELRALSVYQRIHRIPKTPRSYLVLQEKAIFLHFQIVK